MRALLVVTTMFLCCIGCRKPDERVVKAMQERDAAVRMYVVNDDAEDEVLLQAFRKAEVRRLDEALKRKMDEIDRAYESDLMATSGLTADSALALTKKAQGLRGEAGEKYRAELARIDSAVDALRKVRKKNKLNLAVATKLNELLAKYASAGVDMSDAEAGVDELLKIIAQMKNGE